MDQQSISINIFGRRFPMKVNAEEEVVVKEAARMINEQISAFKSIYTTQDDLNIALMCCLKITSDLIRDQKGEEADAEEVLNTLASLEESLDQALKES